MKAFAIAILSLILVSMLVCAVMVVSSIAQEPKPVPVIVRSGLTVESCSDNLVIITAPLDACRYVVHQKTISKPKNKVTVTVQCANDPVN